MPSYTYDSSAIGSGWAITQTGATTYTLSGTVPNSQSSWRWVPSSSVNRLKRVEAPSKPIEAPIFSKEEAEAIYLDGLMKLSLSSTSYLYIERDALTGEWGYTTLPSALSSTILIKRPDDFGSIANIFQEIVI